jgi:hypothetical protein
MGAETGKLGGKVADIVSRTHIATKMKLMPHYVRLAMEMQEAFFALTGREHRDTTGKFWGDLIKTGKLSGPALDTAEFLANGHGQWQTLLSGAATGAAMGGGILDIVVNEFAPAVQAGLAANPHKLLAPGDLAAAAQRGIIDMGSAIHEAAKGALNHGNFATLVGLATVFPSPFEAGQLLSRGRITTDQAHEAIRRSGLDAAYVDDMLSLREQLLTPQELASLVTFGVLSEADAAPMAAKSGTGVHDFHMLVLGNGQPPSTEQLLFAYRRKVIDKARLLKGITQGPVRTEWFDVLESQGSVPMSTADAIEAAVQNHLSKGAAQAIAEQNGLLPEHFEPLFQTAGSPPGPQQLLTWWRRGLVKESDVKQALAESRLKPKYVDLLLSTKPALPPMTTIRSAYSHGAIDHGRALNLLADHGYSAQDSDMILAEGHAEKTATVRHLTVTQVMGLYADRAISRDAALAMLGALGYDDTDSGWIVSLADLDRTRRLIAASTGRIRSAYVGRHITAEQAGAQLDALLIPVDQRDDLMTFWDIERATVTKTLTQAQAMAAFKKSIISEGQYRDRLLSMGYAGGDVDVLVALAGGGAQ